MFQVISQCPHERGTCSTQTLSVTQEQFFLLFTPCETSQGLLNAASHKQQPQQLPRNPLCGSRNIYLLYEAATLIRKLLSSPTVLLKSNSVLSDLHMSCCPWAFTPQGHKGLLIEKYQFTEGFLFLTRNIQYQTSHVTVAKLTIIMGTVLENCYNKKCSLELSTCIK